MVNQKEIVNHLIRIPKNKRTARNNHLTLTLAAVSATPICSCLTETLQERNPQLMSLQQNAAERRSL